MLIGLTGTKGSGKGEVVIMLREKGFAYESLSDRVREEAMRRGLENYGVKDLQDIGDELRREYGNGIWAKKTIERLEKNKDCVIDGIRNLGEIEELRKLSDFLLIAVDAPQKQRFERLISRERVSDPKTWEDFLVMDERDRVSREESGQEVQKCIEAADIKIFNDSTLEALRNKFEDIFNKIKC